MAGAVAASSFRDRRAHPRRVFEGHDAAPRVRLRGGREVMPFDLSRGGTCVRTPARLLPGTHVDVRLWTTHWRWQTRASVVRCEVWALCQEDGVRYRAALEFFRPMEVEGEAALDADLQEEAAQKEVGYLVPGASMEQIRPGKPLPELESS